MVVKKAEDRGMEMLDGQVGFGEPPAQQIQQAGDEQTQGQDDGKDQEK